MKKEDDWCIVRYVHQEEQRKGKVELLVFREYQWEPQAKRFDDPHKWEYVAKDMTHQQAHEFSSLFKD
jgi:hypothetical protein